MWMVPGIVAYPEKRFAVVGAGALGCYFAALLAKADVSVALIARGAHLAAIRASGIEVLESTGGFTVAPDQVTDQPADVGPVDAVILAVKSWQVTDAARLMAPLLQEGTKVLPLQNGVETFAQLEQILGPGVPLYGLCKVVCSLEAPGRVKHVGVVPTIALGEAHQTHLSANAQALTDALSAAGARVEVPADMQVALWEKLLFISAASGTAAVSRSTIGELRACPETRRLLQAVMLEVLAVARARQVAIGDDVVPRALAFIDSMPPTATTSMQRDIAAGKRSELEAITGVVVRFGRELGIPVPASEFVYASLLPQHLRGLGA